MLTAMIMRDDALVAVLLLAVVSVAIVIGAGVSTVGPVMKNMRSVTLDFMGGWRLKIFSLFLCSSVYFAQHLKRYE